MNRKIPLASLGLLAAAGATAVVLVRESLEGSAQGSFIP